MQLLPPKVEPGEIELIDDAGRGRTRRGAGARTRRSGPRSNSRGAELRTHESITLVDKELEEFPA